MSAATTIWFGTKNDDRANPPPLAAARDLTPSAAPVPRILIVEDELFVAWHLESILQDLQFEICGMVGEGELAIEKAKELNVNIVLMDINLGGQMDGIDAAANIKREQQASIIFVTAYTDENTRRRINAVLPGAPLLAKPVSPDELRRAIEAVWKTRGH